MTKYTVVEIISVISEQVAEITDIELSQIDPDRNILDYGFDSLRSIHLIGQLEIYFNSEISETAILEFPTIRKLAAHLQQQVAID